MAKKKIPMSSGRVKLPMPNSSSNMTPTKGTKIKAPKGRRLPSVSVPKVKATTQPRRSKKALREQEKIEKQEALEIQKLITKQRTRIKGIIKRAQARGYEYLEDVYNLTDKSGGKERLAQLKAVKPKDVYKQLHYIDYDTGEYFSGEERRHQERRVAYYKGRNAKQLESNRALEQARAVLEEHRQFLNSLPQELKVWVRAGRGARKSDVIPFASVLLDAFERAVQTKGEVSVARVIEINAERIQDLAARLQQESDIRAIVSGMNEIINIYNSNLVPISADEMQNVETAADMLQGFTDIPYDMIPEQWR